MAAYIVSIALENFPEDPDERFVRGDTACQRSASLVAFLDKSDEEDGLEGIDGNRMRGVQRKEDERGEDACGELR